MYTNYNYNPDDYDDEPVRCHICGYWIMQGKTVLIDNDSNKPAHSKCVDGE